MFPYVPWNKLGEDHFNIAKGFYDFFKHNLFKCPENTSHLGPCIHCPRPEARFIQPHFSASTVGSPLNIISFFGLSQRRLQCSVFPPKLWAEILSSMSEIILSGTLFSSCASPTSSERVIKPSSNTIDFTKGIFCWCKGCSDGIFTMNSSTSTPLTPILYAFPITPARGFLSLINAS